jgi:phosphoribosylformimino-5-aminoimidazole carboxamide ribotide isomerase
VRLTQGDYKKKKVYDQSPLEIAIQLNKKGFEYLHLVDLDGARANSPKNLYTLNHIALETNLHIDFGGGIKSEDSLVQAFRSGAEQVNIGSLSVRNSVLVKFWLMKYGAEKIIIGADVKDNKLSVNGWQDDTDIDIMDFINDYSDSGAKTFVCTDISKDGMMQGSSIELYDRILDQFPNIRLIASGGVSSIKEIKQLEEIGVDGVILGKALYEGLIDQDELLREFQ